MQKIYLVSYAFDHCNNESSRVFPEKSRLCPLGYALIAIEENQKYADSLACLIENLIEDQEAYYFDSDDLFGILFKKDAEELILEIPGDRPVSMKIKQDDFIKLAQDFLQITGKNTPEVIELIQNDNGSYTFSYQRVVE